MSSERFERIHGTEDDLSHLSAKDGVKAGRGWGGAMGVRWRKIFLGQPLPRCHHSLLATAAEGQGWGWERGRERPFL